MTINHIAHGRMKCRHNKTVGLQRMQRDRLAINQVSALRIILVRQHLLTGVTFLTSARLFAAYVPGEGMALPEWRNVWLLELLHSAWVADDRIDDLRPFGMISATVPPAFFNIGHLAPPSSCRDARYTQWITNAVREESG